MVAKRGNHAQVILPFASALSVTRTRHNLCLAWNKSLKIHTIFTLPESQSLIGFQLFFIPHRQSVEVFHTYIVSTSLRYAKQEMYDKRANGITGLLS